MSDRKNVTLNFPLCHYVLSNISLYLAQDYVDMTNAILKVEVR